MNPDDHSGSTLSMPLADGDFNAEERQAIRKMLRNAVRASDRKKWVGRQLRVTIPLGTFGGTTLWGVIEWIRNHVTLLQ